MKKIQNNSDTLEIKEILKILQKKNNPPAIINSPILNPKIEIPTNGLLNNNKNPMNNNGDSFTKSFTDCMLLVI